MSKILVTGANGLLGANLVHYLSKQGYQVKAMIRKGSNSISLNGAKFELFEGRITNKEEVFKAVSDCDYIIHAAARTSQSPSHLENYIDPNITATKLFIQAAAHYKVKKFIFVSTANCLTNGTIENPGNEKSKFMTWLKDSGYAFSKYLAQEEVLRSVKEENLPACIVYPTFIIGKNDSKPSSGSLLLYVYNNKIVFYPPGGKSFVDATAVCYAIAQALKKGKPGGQYLLSGENMTYRKFYHLVAKQSNQRKIFIPLPRQGLYWIGRISSLLEKVFPISIPLNFINSRLLCLGNYFSNEKAKVELGMKEIPISTSIKKALSWFKKNEYID